MLYYLALCSGLIIGQLTHFLLYKTLAYLCFAISLFCFNQLIKLYIKLPKLQLIITLISLGIISFAYSNLRTIERINNRIDMPISKINTQGYLIAPIKNFESINQTTLHITKGSLADKNLIVYFESPINLLPATIYQLTLNIYPTSELNNVDNFDLATYYLAHNIAGNAKLINYHTITPTYQPLALINQIRSTLINYLHNTTQQYKYSGFFIALATGYQNYIPREQWDMFQKTGINHIVSISGLHLTLVTGFFALLLLSVLKKCRPTRTPRQIVIALSSIILATCYALLAGFGIPIQRALYMLMIASYLLTIRKYIPILYQLIICLTISLIIDPFAVFSIGFWFSYTLISGLLINNTQPRYPNKYQDILKLQFVLLLLGIPLSLYYFSKFSIISTITNLWAVPILGTIFTPSVLISSLLHIDIIIQLIVKMLGYAMLPIEWLANVNMLHQTKPNLATVILAYIGVLLFILRIPFKYKNLVAMLLFSTLFFTHSDKIPANKAKITIFSSTSGGIVLIQTYQTTLLYIDSEPSNTNKTINTLLPHLQAQHIGQINYLINPQTANIAESLASYHVYIQNILNDKQYIDGFYFTQLKNQGLLIQGQKSFSYIGNCNNDSAIDDFKPQNIILPYLTTKCNLIYQYQPQQLIINGNNKSQSKINAIFNNLHFETNNYQNISNNKSTTVWLD